jgi:ADP-ribose pyrophosphatase YjhB (NUDIX family)
MTDQLFRFCPRCAATLVQRPEKGRGPERPTCDRCGFIHYLDPKVAVGTIIRLPNDEIVLARRAIEPGYGLWVFPGGYIDRGETLEDGARREALEECGLEVELDGLINAYSYQGHTPIVVVYAARMTGGTLHASDEESLEVRAFAPMDIPWDSLAFDSTRQALREYLGLEARG